MSFDELAEICGDTFIDYKDQCPLEQWQIICSALEEEGLEICQKNKKEFTIVLSVDLNQK